MCLCHLFIYVWMTCNERSPLCASQISFCLVCSVDRWQRKCISYIHCVPTHRHTIFDMWWLKNCCCFVDTSNTCWHCENLVKLLCFDLIFRIKVSGHTMLAVLVFICLVYLFMFGTAEFCRKAFPLPSDCRTFTYKWTFLDNKLFSIAYYANWNYFAIA